MRPFILGFHTGYSHSENVIIVSKTVNGRSDSGFLSFRKNFCWDAASTNNRKEKIYIKRWPPLSRVNLLSKGIDPVVLDFFNGEYVDV